jgi:5-methylcytosine-specific restriction endonuclease McrA
VPVLNTEYSPPLSRDSILAQQKFSAIFREALRVAHGEKCIYCGRHILFLETKIDHVLPESTLQDPIQTRELKQRFGLPDSFDLLGYENLAPSCEPCNGKKSALLLQAGFIAIVLADIKKRIPRLLDLLAERRAQVNLDKVLRSIAFGLEQGSFSRDALIRGFRNLTEERSSASEERQDEAYFTSRRQILFSRHVVDQMQDRGIGVQDIYGAINSAAKHRTLSAERISGTSRYQIHDNYNLRVIYEIRGNTIFIITADQTRPNRPRHHT